MRGYHYRAAKNLVGGLCLTAMAVGSGWAWLNSGGGFVLLGTLLFAGLGALCLRAGISSEPAIAFDASELRLRGSLQGARASWRQVHAITLEVLTTRYMGVIPVSKQTFLSVRVEGGLFGSRTVRIALDSVALPVGGPAELLRQLQSAHVAAVGIEGVAMAGAGEHGWGVGPARAGVAADASGGFDADAALQRYLQRRD